MRVPARLRTSLLQGTEEDVSRTLDEQIDNSRMLVRVLEADDGIRSAETLYGI